MRLLKIMPLKAEKVTDDMASGKRRRTGRRFGRGIAMLLSRLERKYQGLYSKSLKVKETCTGCGWCVQNCPKNNIKMEEGVPRFGDGCIICLRCIYGCPGRSIYTEKYKRMLFSKGFSLEDIEKRMDGVELLPIEKCCRGIAWIGVRWYLEEE
jgi:ferredoxin